uniref:Uncharacterized protein n=1 Tax=Thermosporothrix sp. COM3 TaxID=2490863 RepID=A0A455SDY3_9CHLR|nr:hypothetical protein KTC_14140 [Thermosporothrix sp. COM3]
MAKRLSGSRGKTSKVIPINREAALRMQANEAQNQEDNTSRNGSTRQPNRERGSQH